uniref:Secreted protein n=1 Tax=Steinernema glaseri TaxID=37863 RepID=A0A1I7ZC17_9BILA
MWEFQTYSSPIHCTSLKTLSLVTGAQTDWKASLPSEALSCISGMQTLQFKPFLHKYAMLFGVKRLQRDNKHVATIFSGHESDHCLRCVR